MFLSNAAGVKPLVVTELGHSQKQLTNWFEKLNEVINTESFKAQ